MLIRFRTRALVLLISLALFGCASDKIVKTYDGELLAEDAIAVLTAPENITLLSVNGKEVQQYLLSNLAVNYGLKEGENLIVFKYQSIWSRAKKDEQTGLRVDVVESEPLVVRLYAKPGAKYNFSFLPASNVREANALASSFVAQVLDQQQTMIAESVALNTYQKEKEKEKELALQEEQKILSEKQGDKAASLDLEGASVIEKLKILWPNASDDEKKAFLVWVFQ